MPKTAKDTDLYVICYDIPDDRRRARIHKTLSSFGQWRQYSLFECYLTRKQQVQLMSRVTKQIKPAEDHIRVYQLCKGCETRVETIGGPAPADPVAYLV